MTVNLIELGDGKWIINHGTYGGRKAVFIEPAPAPGEVGADASKSGLRKTEVAEGGTVITLRNNQALGVLVDELHRLLNTGAA